MNLPSVSEVKEAIEVLKPVIITRPGDMQKGEAPRELSCEHKAIQTLLTLAQAYQQILGCVPPRRKIVSDDGSWYERENIGFNACRNQTLKNMGVKNENKIR
jgi:hypothetical protein